MLRLGRPAGLAIGLVGALAGCGQGPVVLPPACSTTAAGLERALGAAPGPVVVAPGTPISTCVAHAISADDLQAFGSLLSTAADQLAIRAPASPTVALELGYLVGATRRGAARTNGAASELQRRIESAAALRGAGPPALAALHRGIGAGQRSG